MDLDKKISQDNTQKKKWTRPELKVLGMDKTWGGALESVAEDHSFTAGTLS